MKIVKTKSEKQLHALYATAGDPMLSSSRIITSFNVIIYPEDM
jgi:hypothetical protein